MNETGASQGVRWKTSPCEDATGTSDLVRACPAPPAGRRSRREQPKVRDGEGPLGGAVSQLGGEG